MMLMHATTRTVLRSLADVLLPTACPCGVGGRVLCADCAAVLEMGAERVDDRLDALQLAVPDELGEHRGAVSFAPRMPVVAAGDYTARLQALVLAFKNGGHFALAEPFARSLLDPARELLRHGGVLVPVPSSGAAVRRRGEQHTQLIAEALGESLRTAVVSCLSLPRASGAPAGLPGGASAARSGAAVAARSGGAVAGRRVRNRRERRLSGGMRVSGRAVTRALGSSHFAAEARSAADEARSPTTGTSRNAPGRGPSVVLVDDVATTGATLAAAADALEAAGCRVLGAVVVAAAQRVGPTSVRP